MKLAFKLNLGKHVFMFNMMSMQRPMERTWGKSSRIPSTNNHVLFLDYDSIDQNTLEDELYAVMEEYEIGNIHLFKLDRENAYHAVCLDYFYLHDVKIIACSTSCDIGFVLAPRYDVFRNWVLRDATKGNRSRPIFLKTLESPFEGNRLQSQAHALFLNGWYGCKIALTNPDGNTILRLENYLTKKRTDKN